MKIRKGFVSNSSTTSFTCDICGLTEGGMDSEGIEDFGFTCCANGHYICIDHVEGEINDHYEMSEDLCPICQKKAVDLSNLPFVMAFLMKKPLKQIKEEILELTKANGQEWITEAIKFATTNP